MLEPMPQILYTAEDLHAFDENYELDQGVLVPMSCGSFEHGEVALSIGASLRQYVRANRLGRVVGNDTGFILERGPDTVRGPDVAFVRADRLKGRHRKMWDGAPDLAVEVVSPSDRPAEVLRKVYQYLTAGCGIIWVVDTERATVVSYRADGLVRTFGSNDVLSGEDVIPGFECRVADLLDIGLD